MLCYVMLCYVMLCCVVLCYVMLCYVVLCCVVLCYVMPCCVMLCHVMFCSVLFCSVLLFCAHVISRHANAMRNVPEFLSWLAECGYVSLGEGSHSISMVVAKYLSNAKRFRSCQKS